MKRLVFSGVLVLLISCTQPSVCEARGGQCQRTDVVCGVGLQFDGFDPSCEPNSKCCLPLNPDSGTPPDAGNTPQCTSEGGTCVPVSMGCAGGHFAAVGTCTTVDQGCCIPGIPDAGH
jgi:hypothetical protein